MGAVHLGVPSHLTGWIGNYATPVYEIATACAPAGTWTADTRPRRTLRRDRVTCSVCLRWCEAHEDAFVVRDWDGMRGMPAYRALSMDHPDVRAFACGREPRP